MEFSNLSGFLESLLHPRGQVELLQIVQVAGLADLAPLQVLEEDPAGVRGTPEGSPARESGSTELTEDQLGGPLAQADTRDAYLAQAGARLAQRHPGLQPGDDPVKDGVRLGPGSDGNRPGLGRELRLGLGLVAVVVDGEPDQGRRWLCSHRPEAGRAEGFSGHRAQGAGGGPGEETTTSTKVVAEVASLGGESLLN